MPFWLSARSPILLSSRVQLILQMHLKQFAKSFQKKDRTACRRRSKSGRKRPGKGSDSGAAIADTILQIENFRALTPLNFRPHIGFFCIADASRPPDGRVDVFCAGTMTPVKASTVRFIQHDQDCPMAETSRDEE